MSQLNDEAIRNSIIRVLSESVPLKALDIFKKISGSTTKKDVNRVLYSMERRELERSNPGQNPPLWMLVQSSPERGSRRLSSPGSVGGFPPPSSGSPSPRLPPATRAASNGGSNISPEVYSKTEHGDGAITFAPINPSSVQMSPELVSIRPASDQATGTQDLFTPKGVSDTGPFDPHLQFQRSDNTALGTVATPILPTQPMKKKKPKVKLAASFGGHTQEEESSSRVDHCEPPEVTHTQESELPDAPYIGQEMDRADNEYVTQERSHELADDMSSLSIRERL